MLKSNTAYVITPSNANVLSHITGHPLNVLTANVGWTAAYSETSYPRWAIVPKSVAKHDLKFEIDAASYSYKEKN